MVTIILAETLQNNGLLLLGYITGAIELFIACTTMLLYIATVIKNFINSKSKAYLFLEKLTKNLKELLTIFKREKQNIEQIEKDLKEVKKDEKND